MKVKLLKESFYVFSEKLDITFKITQVPDKLFVTIELVDSLPEDGEYVPPGDITMIAVYDNLWQTAMTMAKTLESEALDNPF